MRFAVVIGLPLLLLGSSVYFLAKPKEDTRLAAIVARLDQAPPAAVDDADAADTALVRTLLNAGKLNDEQGNILLIAAGRRYIRRRDAFSEAQQAVEAGKAPAASLDVLRKEMDLARNVCDFAESFGRRNGDIAAMVMAEMELGRTLTYSPAAMARLGLTDRFSGINTFSDADLKQMSQAFLSRFGRPLPVSAKGDSAVHRALGFDHRGRVDVAVSPLQPEGVWVRRYLSDKGITFFAFSSAIRGKATGAHIHIGGASGRVGHTN